MRHGVTRDEVPKAPIPDLGHASAMRGAERVAKMAMKGDVAQRVTAATRDLVASWRAEDISGASLRRRIEALQTEIDCALPGVEQFVVDAEGLEARRHAECQFAAVRAMSDVIGGELQEMGLLL
ncbi:MAG: hypothetical protein JWR10_3415 [Rubritepida sp.]|nr:hypothetical protein [Rubritepida sp.]